MPTASGTRIVCLCGSTKYWEEFEIANRDETLAGRIVLSVGVDMKKRHADILEHKTKQELEEIKDRLDCLHRRKIDLADEIFVLDIDGKSSIGESTSREIDYAQKTGKPIRYWSLEKIK